MNDPSTRAPHPRNGAIVFTADDGSVYVRTWQRTFALRGGTAERALEAFQAADGERSVEEIADRLGWTAETAQAVFDPLVEAGIVGYRVLPDSAADTAPIAEVIAGGREQEADGHGIVLIGAGPAVRLAADLIRASSRSPVSICDSVSEYAESSDPEAAALLIDERISYRELLRMDDEARAHGRLWAAVWWEGAAVVASHEIRSGVTACFSCLLERQRANYEHPEIDTVVERRLTSGEITTAGGLSTTLPPLLVSSLMASIGALRAFSMIRESPPNHAGRLAEVDVSSMTTEWSNVLRLPSCSRCNEGLLRPRRFGADG